MPDPTTTTEVTVETETESTDQPTKDWEAEAKKWREMSRKTEAQAKANADKAKRWEEHEQAAQSEDDKRAQKLAAAEAKAAESELKLLKLEVGLERGLTKTQAQRLVGENREDLEADADELIVAFGINAEDDEDTDGEPAAPPSSRPKENLRPGRKGPEPMALNGDPLTRALKQKLGIR